MPRPSCADETLNLLQRLAQGLPLPRVRALQLPAAAAPGAAADRGEFCAIELDGGAIGLSYALLDDALARLRAAGADPLAGADALAVAAQLRGAPGPQRAVGLAAANALARWFWDRAGWQPPAAADALGAIAPQPGGRIGMVGLFRPLLPARLASGAEVVVIELKAELAGPRDGWRVALDPAELQRCDQVLATGTLVLNDTLDAVLAHCRGARRVAVVGPSAGGLPDALFARGVDYVGSSWIVDGRAWLDALAGGTPRSGLTRKVGIERSGYPGFEALLARM